MAVDIGYEAVSRFSDAWSGRTRIAKGNPASMAGNVTSIDIYARSDISGLVVGSFYTTNGNTLKCRDSETIPGTITSGSKVNKVVSVTVEIGDYIGCYFSGGKLAFSGFGGDGIWLYDGEAIDPDDEETYTLYDGDVISLGGYIEEVVVAAGRSFGFIIG